MPVADEETILRDLQAGVVAAMAASSDPDLPVKYLDVAFTVPNDKKWLEVAVIPNNRVGDFWGNEQVHQGLMRLILHWPNNGAGIYTPITLLGSIAGYFSVGLVLSTVQVYEVPGFTGGLPEGDEVLYPASIRYRSYQT